MKTMVCIDCGEGSFTASTPQEMMQAMMPHYKDSHADMMAGQTAESHAEWMQRFQKVWEEAPEKE